MRKMVIVDHLSLPILIDGLSSWMVTVDSLGSMAWMKKLGMTMVFDGSLPWRVLVVEELGMKMVFDGRLPWRVLVEGLGPQKMILSSVCLMVLMKELV